MKRLITLLALLLLPVWAQGAYAQVFIDFFPNMSAPNAFAQFKAPGGMGTVFADGGALCNWCVMGYPFNTPGASLNPSTPIEYDDLSGAINCNPFAEGCPMSDDQITALRDITFPKNGQEFFSVTVPATESGVSGAVVPPEGGEMPFTLGGASGELTLDFVLSPPPVSDEPSLYFLQAGRFTSAPEPSTLGLMAAGLAGLAFLGRRRGV